MAAQRHPTEDNGLPDVMVRRLPANTEGRDFIVGDIHGAYDAVVEAMRAVHFDRKRDRLISVGDLIDRGKGSARVAGFLAQPYVHAVRGNHDHEFARLTPEEVRVLATVPILGMGWARNLSDEALFEIQAALRQLPVAIEIPTARGLVGVVHAQPLASMTWPRFVAALERRDPDAVASALFSRDRGEGREQQVVVGVGRVFVGHCVQRSGPRFYGNVVAIDTGAVLHEMGVEGCHLTMTRLVAQSAALSDLARPEGSFAALDSDCDEPFSALRHRG